ncbi:MAG: class II fructose-bisphosphate aldolase, partial [Proteocatella sp.]
NMCNQYGAQIPGAKGVPEEMLNRASKFGVCKINVDTDLRMAMTAAIRRVLVESPKEFDPRKYLGPGRDAIEEIVSHKIRDVFGSSGSALKFK